jgi:hypothetical protein
MRKFAVFLAASLICVCGSSSLSAKITEDSLRKHIKILASDDFEGRDPGTEGEKKTIQYISSAWKSAGLKPAGKDGSWFLPVPLLQYGQSEAKVSFSSAGRTLKFNADEAILNSKDTRYKNGSVPIVFGGYGFKSDGGVIGNVTGKIVLLLTDKITAGNNGTRSANIAKEALVKAGAEGVILVAEGEPGNWTAMRRRFLSGPVVLEGTASRAAIEGAISSEFAVGMVTAAYKDWDKLRLKAKEASFDTVDLGVSASVDITTSIRRFESNNVLGRISGKKPGSGSIIFLSHWDHLGICRPESEADRICNGAVDNASGIAVITEVARVLSKSRHDRDIYFLATTAEEKGLLGARQFAAQPVMPLTEIVAAFNIDTIAVAPKGTKVAILGRGQTGLDAGIDQVTSKMKRRIQTSAEANALIRRQDGWALTEKGVPTVMVGGSIGDMSLLEKFLGGVYHGPDDELLPSTILSGAAEDADLHVALGKHFANVKSYQGNKTGG